jgi:hypothetical protein
MVMILIRRRITISQMLGHEGQKGVEPSVESRLSVSSPNSSVSSDAVAANWLSPPISGVKRFISILM